MEPADLTIEILASIRDEIRDLRADMDGHQAQTNQRLDQTNQRLDQTNQRLNQLHDRQTQLEIRLATELVGVAKAVGEVKELLAENLGVNHRVDDHEVRIGALERKLG